MPDLLTDWTQTQEAQRKAQGVVDSCRVRKTWIVHRLLDDGMTRDQVAVLLGVHPTTVDRLGNA